MRLQPGQRSTRYHAEDQEEEAFYIVSGRMNLELEGEVHRLGPGDFVLTFPGDAHQFWNDHAEPSEFLAFGGPDLETNCTVYPFGKDPTWHERTISR